MTVRMQKCVCVCVLHGWEKFLAHMTCFLQLNFTLVSLILGNTFGVFAQLLSLTL